MPTPLAPPSFPPPDADARVALLDWIRQTPLVYGPWQGFKRLYKDVETAFIEGTREPEIMAALLSRLDAQSLDKPQGNAALPGKFSALCARDGFAYAMSGDALQSYDLSSPAQPRLVSSQKIELPEYAMPQLVLTEARLWLQCGSKLWAFDLSAPAEPRLIGAFDTCSNHTTLAGERVVSLSGHALRVLELRGAALSEVGTCDLGENYSYSLQGGPNFAAALFYNYRLGSSYQLQFVDLSNPAQPRVAGRMTAEYGANFQRSGQNWVGLGGEQLLVSDFSDLDKPRRVGKLRMKGAANLVCQNQSAAVYCREYVYENQHYETRTQLRFVDLSRPGAPRLVGESDAGELRQLAQVGPTLFALAKDGIHIYDISDPARAQEIGKSPDPKTFAYLKRRGRRFLRLLSETDQTAFCHVAAAFFAEISARPNLNWDANWIAADLVAARHPNWCQASHGRGAYLYQPEKFVLKRRVERAPSAWDAHPETLRPLLESATAPVAHLARQVTDSIAPLSPAQIESYVASRWPNLRVIGARAARHSAGLSPRAIAGALFALSARSRRELLARVGTSPALASELASFLGESVPVERDRFGRRKRTDALTRRGREVALLLAARFDLSDPAFRADGALPALRALLGAGEAPLRALGAQFCRRLSADQVLPLIPFAVQNAAVLDALLESAARADFDKAQIDKAIRAEAPAARAVAWQLIEASQTASATLGEVWLSLFRGLTQNYDAGVRGYRWQTSAPLQSAATDANARACLVRGKLDANEVRPRWSSDWTGTQSSYYASVQIPGEMFGLYALFLPGQTLASTIAELTDAQWANWRAPFIAAIAPHAGVCAGFWRATQEYLDGKSPAADIERLRARTFMDAQVAATFAGAAGQLSPDLLLSLIGSVPGAVWQSWRASLLNVLQSDAERRRAFWSAARAQGFDNETLRIRLIEDAELAATFGLLPKALEFDDPALQTLLLTWLGARELDENTAIEAAIHPLPDVRAVGLAALEKRGLSVPIALRLLESDLRDAMDAAKNWFESRSENIANLALALCDSPKLPARDYGREFVAARLDALLGDGLLPKLEENPNAEMQSFVAQLLLEKADAEPTEFDRAVLRGRNRARHAKSLVQQRRAETAPLPDDATLLELARGKTPRDAEWALMQLARRALEGQIEGVEVGGVGAI